MTPWLMLVLLAAQVPQPPSFEPVFRQAVARRLKEYGPRHPKYAQSLVRLALFLHWQNPKSAEPERLLRQALAITPESLAAGIHEDLGDILAARGRPASTHYERALAIREKQSPGEIEPLLTKLGDLRAEAGKHAEAELFYRRALALLEKRNEPRRLANAFNNLGIVLEAQDRINEAEPFYLKAVAAYEQALGPRHPEVASVLINLAGAALARGDTVAAESSLTRSLAILESTVGPAHPRVADACDTMSAVMQAKGDNAAASRYRQRAEAIRQGSAPR